MGYAYTKKIRSTFYLATYGDRAACKWLSPISLAHWKAYLGRKGWAEEDAPFCFPKEYEP